ncbi:MAG: hypothetical protein CVU23_13975 [Betaproteobacteria bacterium HGW-Betaproteobacteria-17]|nr:MAG: hypothetical protein CVU23_13975 [Betaproteobacteria bacterium HGW-Betaproteobacteria-17]
MNTLEQRLAESQKRTLARLRAMGDIGEGAIVKHEDPTREQWQMIHPGVERAGGWRLTTFDLKGFSGHMCFAGKDEAMSEAARNGFYIRDDEALGRLQHTPAFIRGNYVLGLLEQINGGKITSFDAAAMLNEYDERMNRMAA